MVRTDTVDEGWEEGERTVAYAEGGSGGFSPQKIFGFSGLKTHGFLSFEAPYPMYFFHGWCYQ